MKIAIIIPAHNEAQAIGPLVEAVRALGYDCIVIDDGSMDKTAAVAAQAGAVVLKTGGKSGKGNALKVGFDYVRAHGYEALIAMDGDGQHSPSDIVAFVACYQKTDADIVSGNRMQDPQGMPLVRLADQSFHVLADLPFLPPAYSGFPVRFSPDQIKRPKGHQTRKLRF